jgi:hypothetical protein
MEVFLVPSLLFSERAAINIESLRPFYEVTLLLGVAFRIEICCLLLNILSSVPGVFEFGFLVSKSDKQAEIIHTFPTSVDMLEQGTANF